MIAGRGIEIDGNLISADVVVYPATNRLDGTETPSNWKGLNNFNASSIWEHMGTTYMSDGTHHYGLAAETRTWAPVAWEGLPNSAPASPALGLVGSTVWHMNGHTYLSNGTTQMVLGEDSEGKWFPMQWQGLPVELESRGFYAQDLWNVGEEIYMSVRLASTDVQLHFNQDTNSWEAITWTGMPTDSPLEAACIWTDGLTTYFSRGMYQYMLEAGTRNWVSISWEGLPRFNGSDIWRCGGDVFHSGLVGGAFKPMRLVSGGSHKWEAFQWQSEFLRETVWVAPDGAAHVSSGTTQLDLDGVETPTRVVVRKTGEQLVLGTSVLTQWGQIGGILQDQTDLQDALTTERTERLEGDAVIGSSLHAETLARTSGDNALQEHIDAESVARSSEDSILQQHIDTETTARQNADADLQEAITEKQNRLQPGSNITIVNDVISATDQVQSDWAETNTSSKSYIKNKPTEYKNEVYEAGNVPSVDWAAIPQYNYVTIATIEGTMGGSPALFTMQVNYAAGHGGKYIALLCGSSEYYRIHQLPMTMSQTTFRANEWMNPQTARYENPVVDLGTLVPVNGYENLCELAIKAFPTDATTIGQKMDSKMDKTGVVANEEGTVSVPLEELTINGTKYGVLGDRSVTGRMINCANARIGNPYVCENDGYFITNAPDSGAVDINIGNSSAHYAIAVISNGGRSILFCVKGLNVYLGGAPKSAVFVPVSYT